MADIHESRKNFVCWKMSQLCCYVVSAAAAVITAVAVSNATAMFGQRCPLYARVDFVLSNGVNTTPAPRLIRITDASDHLMSSMGACDISTFIPVACAAYAFIMAYFILMCDRMEKLSSATGSGSRNRMLGLFFPLLLSSGILSILMLVTSIRTSAGTDVFCQALLDSISVRCADANQYVWPDYPDAKYFYFTLLAAITSGWVSTVICMMSFLVLILRCFAGVDRVPKPTHQPVQLRIASPSTSEASSKAVTDVNPLLSKEFKESQPGPSNTSSPVHQYQSAA